MLRHNRERFGSTSETRREHTDPLSQLISQAVEDAIEVRLPDIVAAIAGTIAPPPTVGTKDASSERFVRMRDLEKILNADRSTIRRRSIRGVYPPLRKIGASVGFFQSDLDVIFSKA